jgi:hypothetical protein
MTQPPEDHLKALWKGQETEVQPMSVEAIRMRADAYQTRLRRRYVAVAIMLVGETIALAWFAWTARNTVIRTGDLLFIVAIAWMAWRLRDRWPRELPGNLGSARALVEFHGTELQRQKFRAGSMMISLGPALVALVVLLVGMRTQEGRPTWGHWWPIAALTALWVVALWWQVRRHVRQWRRQVEEVDATPLD